MITKQTLVAALLISGVSLFAGEPFILKTNNGRNFLKDKPALFEKKKSYILKTDKEAESLKKNIGYSGKSAAGANFDGEPNIAIKMNLTQLGFKNLSFQGEYGFHPKMSVALGFSSLLKSKVPGYSGDANFGPLNYSGFALTPEFRFYPGGKEEKPAPNGFYIAAYIRYAKYKMTQTVSYTEENTPQNPHPFPKTYSANSTQTYGGVNGGIMIGRQWIIGKHFNIDWWIVGAGYGKAKYTYEWFAPGANLNAADQARVKQEAEDNFGDFSALGWSGTVSTTANSAKTTLSGLPMYSFRFMGLCLGYAF